MKELKDSIFVSIVGEDCLPKAKLASVAVLIPAILVYSFLVDRLKRYQLLYVYCGIYAVAGLAFAYMLSHPTIGLLNTVASQDRYFGWAFYFFYEGYSPFVVSLMWAFANSITEPGFARQGYALMAGFGKLGGMLSAIVAWYLFRSTTFCSVQLTDVSRHQYIMVLSSLLLALVPVVIYILMRSIPDTYLHGYEAAYKYEEKTDKHESSIGLFAGLRMLVKQPYVLGIFGMIFFYEIINVVLSYHRILAARGVSSDASALTCCLFEQIFYMSLASFVLSFFGTNTLVRVFGVRRCLMMVPLLSGVFILVYLLNRDHHHMLTAVFIIIRAINYGIMYPLRESLYIPTTNDIKFKSKSWIDSFGSKLSKAFGSSFNWMIPLARLSWGEQAVLWIQAPLFSVIIGAWFGTAFLLGRRYSRTVAHNEVIGVEKETESI